jgi:hypothetical protein
VNHNHDPVRDFGIRAVEPSRFIARESVIGIMATV